MINGVSHSNPYKPRSSAAPAGNVQAGGPATAAQSVRTSQTAQAPSAQNQVEPLGQMLTQMFSVLTTALKGLIGWIANLFKQPAEATQPPASQPPAGQSQPPAAQPPVAQPPVSQPPATQPPVAEKPVEQPPVVKPPVAEKPVEQPPVVEPPVAEKPVEQPPVVKPPVAEKPVEQPPVVEPPVAEKPVEQPPVVEPPVAEKPVEQPPVVEPPVAEKPVEQPPVVEPPVAEKPVEQPPAAEPATGGIDDAAIAKQYNLLATPENVQAFLAEVKTYEATGALGPGATNTSAVKDLQAVLASFGFAVPVTGVYDNGTAQAVMQFKIQNGLHQTYRSADGQLAVNEYADKQTLELLMKKLEALMNQPPAQPAPVQAAPAPAPEQAPVQATPAPAPVPAPQAPVAQPKAPNPLGLEWVS